MNEKKTILIVNLAQYGKHTDTYKYCAYLNKEYNIYYICIDNNLPKINDGTNVIYLKNSGNSLINTINLILESRKLLRNIHINVTMITYFKLCSLIKCCLPSNYILDIRTGSVDKSLFKRIKFNKLMKLESYFFKNISIISESLRKQLKYKKNKCIIIPLGSDILSVKNKIFNKNKLKLIYVGTLYSRNIYQTIYGLKKFQEEMKDYPIEITYNIFGDGLQEDIDILKQSIEKCKLEQIVKYHGRKNHSEIQEYLDNSNIGISYVPITDYFNCQPPTKTFEYINSGMICLATNTNENKKIINDDNGKLCVDDIEGFKNALLEIYDKIENYDSILIRKTVEKYAWSKIVENKVKIMFESLGK